MTTVVRVHQVLVHAPVQAVFDYVSDLARHPEWSGGELKIEAVTPGPITVGKEYRSRGEVAIQKDRPNTVQVAQYEPPHKFGLLQMILILERSFMYLHLQNRMEVF